MPLLILFILIALPVMEISVFIRVGGQIGASVTVLLTIFTAFAGIYLARRQGLVVAVKMRESLALGKPPVKELIHGFFLFVGGICLLIPGFITDVFGVLLLLPPVRSWLGRMGAAQILSGNPERATYRGPDGKTIIEGEFRHVEPSNGTGNDDNEEQDENHRLPPS